MSRDIRIQLSNLTECSICIATYSDPRLLPCVHTFCLKCIKGYTKDKLSGDHVACPICRKEFLLPENGVDDLPKNFFIEQLKDVTDKSSINREGCSDDSTDAALRKQAAMFCVECQQRFCETCAEAHKRMRVSREHKLINSGYRGKIRVAVTEMKSISCNKHPNRSVETYCTVCKEAICFVCFLELHQFHKCTDVIKVVDECRQQMTNDINNMAETVEKRHDALKKQEKMKYEFSNTVKEIEKEICERAERLKKIIDSEKQNLLQELASRKGDRIKEIQRITEDVERHISFVESLVKYTEELRDNGAASDVAQQARTLRDRADELMRTDDVYRDVSDLGSVQVSLEAVKPSTEANGRFIGLIHWQLAKSNFANLFQFIRLFYCISYCLSAT